MVHKHDSKPFRIQQSHTSIQSKTQKHAHHCRVTTQINSQFERSHSTVKLNISWIHMHVLQGIMVLMDIGQWIINIEISYVQDVHQHIHK